MTLASTTHPNCDLISVESWLVGTPVKNSHSPVSTTGSVCVVIDTEELLATDGGVSLTASGKTKRRDPSLLTCTNIGISMSLRRRTSERHIVRYTYL